MDKQDVGRERERDTRRVRDYNAHTRGKSQPLNTKTIMGLREGASEQAGDLGKAGRTGRSGGRTDVLVVPSYTDFIHSYLLTRKLLFFLLFFLLSSSHQKSSSC